MFIVLLPIAILAVAGIVYAWVLTDREVRAAKAQGWPQRIAYLSVAGVTVQFLLWFVMFCSFIGAINRRMIGWTWGLEVLFFLVALPCAFKRRGLMRWWLALSSIFFLALTGFGYLVSGIQF